MFVWLIPLLFGVCVEVYGISEEFVAANNDFGMRLCHAVSKNINCNLAFGILPTNIILALVSLGARGQTAREIKSVLGLRVSDAKIKQLYEEITTNLKYVEKVTLKTGTKGYIAEGFDIIAEFLKTATINFNSCFENIDFNENVNTATKINYWIEDNTENRITKIIDENSINCHTRMVLVNTIYFNGRWQNPFYADCTREEAFYISRHETVMVPMMVTVAYFRIFRNDILRATGIFLPYENPKVQLCIILPDELDGLRHLEENAADLLNYRYIEEREVRVFLPKFRIETTTDLIPALQDMGIHELFSDQANLKGITREDISVTSIIQKTLIEVQEETTEAASGSAINAMSSRRGVEQFIANRPFKFIILYEGVSLIAGKVTRF